MKSQNTLLLIKALSFSADKHRNQRRKDADATPYINHPINVVLTLLEIGKETNINLLVAAALHDTIEDTETKLEEIEKLFGKKVLSIVSEVTDDKKLPKAERKQLQVTNAPHKSSKAKKLKLADKICNITDILNSPPADWNQERKLDYLSWAEKVANGLKGANVKLEKHLAKLIEKGKSDFK